MIVSVIVKTLTAVIGMNSYGLFRSIYNIAWVLGYLPHIRTTVVVTASPTVLAVSTANIIVIMRVDS